MSLYRAERLRFNRIQKQYRRLHTKVGYENFPTVGDVAKAVKMTPEEVVSEIRTHGYWITTGGPDDAPVAQWQIIEDGE